MSYRKEIDMNEVIVSPKYQVVIPKAVRDRCGIVPGARLQVLSYDDRIEFVKVREVCEMRGFLNGCDPTFNRDENDRT
jgi:AbrB family looped-hinge helix DNA binding protein